MVDTRIEEQRYRIAQSVRDVAPLEALDWQSLAICQCETKDINTLKANLCATLDEDVDKIPINIW